MIIFNEFYTPKELKLGSVQRKVKLIQVFFFFFLILYVQLFRAILFDQFFCFEIPSKVNYLPSSK